MKRALPAAAGFVLLGFSLPTGAAAQQPVFNCDNPEQQQAMNYCAGVAYGRADRELNRVYRQAMAWAREQDADWQDTDEGKVGAVTALKKAQRGWIDYRDGQCDAYGFQARGGSMEPQLVADCMTDLTKKRTEELHALFEDKGR